MELVHLARDEGFEQRGRRLDLLPRQVGQHRELALVVDEHRHGMEAREGFDDPRAVPADAVVTLDPYVAAVDEDPHPVARNRRIAAAASAGFS